MKQAIVIQAGLVALVLAQASPAAAQGVVEPYPARADHPFMPPPEVAAVVRSIGLEPVTRPVRYGSTYVLRASGPAGQEMRVAVDGRNGRVLSAVPVYAPPYAMPLAAPPYDRPPGRVPTVEGGPPRVAGLPDGAIGAQPYGPPPDNDGPSSPPIGRGQGMAPPSPSGQAGPPPLPRPRPKLASSNGTDAKPATAAAPAPTAPARPVATATAGSAAAGAASAFPLEE